MLSGAERRGCVCARDGRGFTRGVAETGGFGRAFAGTRRIAGADREGSSELGEEWVAAKVCYVACGGAPRSGVRSCGTAAAVRHGIWGADSHRACVFGGCVGFVARGEGRGWR